MFHISERGRACARARSWIGVASLHPEQVEPRDCPSAAVSIKPGRWRLDNQAPISGMLGKFPAKQEMKGSEGGGRSCAGFVPVLKQLYEQMAGDAPPSPSRPSHT